MLSLPDVTLVAVTSVEIEATLMALSISAHAIEFGQIKFLTSEAPISPDPKIQVVNIPRLDWRGYSKFMIESLDQHISTSHCLIIQADGFVLNPDRWQAIFLDYDYIGAPWPVQLFAGPGDHVLDMKSNQVGNGGFSLRSKKLLRETAKINFDSMTFPLIHEDLVICHYLLEDMLSLGIKFPKPEIAAQFAVESPNASFGQNPYTSFGFHGKSTRDEIFKVFKE